MLNTIGRCTAFVWQDCCCSAHMKIKMINYHHFVFPLFLLFFSLANSQDFSAVDTKVRLYEAPATPEKLAGRINADFTSEDDKARAIFTWIASNIKYDLQLYAANGGQRQVAFTYRTPAEKAQKVKLFNQQLIATTWHSKKAVCHGYTELYNHLAKLCQLESVMIPGTSKSQPSHIGKLPIALDHAWNAVKTNGKWHLLDVTWGAGAVNGATGKFEPRFNDSYFFTDPDTFFLNHFPENPKMLMTQKTPEDFSKLPLYYGEYLSSDYKIIAPFAGIISAGSPVSFRIENLEAYRISYVFSSDNQFHPVEPTVVGNFTEFAIPLGKNDSGYLTLYINSNSAVTYKIQRG